MVFVAFLLAGALWIAARAHGMGPEQNVQQTVDIHVTSSPPEATHTPWAAITAAGTGLAGLAAFGTAIKRGRRR